MTKKNYSLLIFFWIVLLFFTFQNIPLVKGLDATIFDSENDVFLIVDDSVIQGDYHDEIDIVKLEFHGQDINLTFAGNTSDWKFSFVNENNIIDTVIFIMFYENFDMSSDAMIFPDYYVYCRNWTGLGFEIFFINIIVEINDDDIFFPEFYFWTGVNWSEGQDQGQNIGLLSDKSMLASISIDAYLIPDNLTYIATSMIMEIKDLNDVVLYLDIAPEKYAPFDTSNGSVPSYELFIFICAMIGISLIIIRKAIRKVKLRLN